MAIDYVKAATTAARLVSENGRSVTFLRLDQTIDDSAKPWRGTSNPRTVPDDTVTTSGVFVSPMEGGALLGRTTTSIEWIKRSEQICIVALGATSTDDLSRFDELLDGTERWRITGVETLKPGSTTLLYFVGVAR